MIPAYEATIATRSYLEMVILKAKYCKIAIIKGEVFLIIVNQVIGKFLTAKLEDIKQAVATNARRPMRPLKSF